MDFVKDNVSRRDRKKSRSLELKKKNDDDEKICTHLSIYLYTVNVK